jgi:hypothetical protein
MVKTMHKLLILILGATISYSCATQNISTNPQEQIYSRENDREINLQLEESFDTKTKQKSIEGFLGEFNEKRKSLEILGSIEGKPYKRSPKVHYWDLAIEESIYRGQINLTTTAVENTIQQTGSGTLQLDFSVGSSEWPSRHKFYSLIDLNGDHIILQRELIDYQKARLHAQIEPELQKNK